MIHKSTYQIIMGLIRKLVEHRQKCHQNNCKSHSPKTLRGIQNLHLPHMLWICNQQLMIDAIKSLGEVYQTSNVMVIGIKIFAPYFFCVKTFTKTTLQLQKDFIVYKRRGFTVCQNFSLSAILLISIYGGGSAGATTTNLRLQFIF